MISFIKYIGFLIKGNPQPDINRPVTIINKKPLVEYVCNNVVLTVIFRNGVERNIKLEINEVFKPNKNLLKFDRYFAGGDYRFSFTLKLTSDYPEKEPLETKTEFIVNHKTDNIRSITLKEVDIDEW